MPEDKRLTGFSNNELLLIKEALTNYKQSAIAMQCGRDQFTISLLKADAEIAQELLDAVEKELGRV